MRELTPLSPVFGRVAVDARQRLQRRLLGRFHRGGLSLRPLLFEARRVLSGMFPLRLTVLNRNYRTPLVESHNGSQKVEHPKVPCSI